MSFTLPNQSVDFLKQLLSTPGPSGDEVAVARLWRGYAGAFADRVWGDVRGNSYAVLEGGAPRVLLAGHIDEIGIAVYRRKIGLRLQADAEVYLSDIDCHEEVSLSGISRSLF